MLVHEEAVTVESLSNRYTRMVERNPQSQSIGYLSHYLFVLNSNSPKLTCRKNEHCFRAIVSTSS